MSVSRRRCGHSNLAVPEDKGGGVEREMPVLPHTEGCSRACEQALSKVKRGPLTLILGKRQTSVHIVFLIP